MSEEFKQLPTIQELINFGQDARQEVYKYIIDQCMNNNTPCDIGLLRTAIEINPNIPMFCISQLPHNKNRDPYPVPVMCCILYPPNPHINRNFPLVVRVEPGNNITDKHDDLLRWLGYPQYIDKERQKRFDKRQEKAQEKALLQQFREYRNNMQNNNNNAQIAHNNNSNNNNNQFAFNNNSNNNNQIAYNNNSNNNNNQIAYNNNNQIAYNNSNNNNKLVVYNGNNEFG